MHSLSTCSNKSAVFLAQKFVAGESGFSSLGVILEIHSHFVPDLTLVDLPGLIEVAMDGMESKSPQMVRFSTFYLFVNKTYNRA